MILAELNPNKNGVKTELEPCDDWYDVPSDEMTLEQARQAVKDLRKKLAEYLDQDPCENAVSRKAAIDIIESWLSCDDYNEAERHIMRAMQSVLYDLPPVTPKEKIGKWINDWEMGMSECSICGETYLWEDYKGTENFHYCPNCGARMVRE